MTKEYLEGVKDCLKIIYDEILVAKELDITMAAGMFAVKTMIERKILIPEIEKAPTDCSQ